MCSPLSCFLPFASFLKTTDHLLFKMTEYCCFVALTESCEVLHSCGRNCWVMEPCRQHLGSCLRGLKEIVIPGKEQQLTL